MLELNVEELNILTAMDGSATLTCKICPESKRDALKYIPGLTGKLIAGIRKHRNKRSLDANAYAWKLIGLIASKIGADPNDIYRGCLRESGGTYRIFPMRPEDFGELDRIWTDNGKKIGWMIDDLGPCRDIPEHNYARCWYGSSAFDTKEMYNLLQNIRQECAALDIPYLTPKEEEELLQAWGKQ